MLYKKIHLSGTYNNCSIDSPYYVLSIDTFIKEQDQYASLYIELDSILEYLGCENINKLITEIKVVEDIDLSRETISSTEKIFVYHEHLNSALAIIYFYLKKLGQENSKLKNAIGDLYFGVISDWHLEATKIKKAYSSLDIFYKAQEYTTHKQIDEVTSLVKMFSSKC